MGRKPSQYFLDLMAEESQKNKKEKPKLCEVDGCPHFGEYKAPKSNHLNEYHNFCLEHVKEYNTKWDYFEGMPQSAVDNQLYNNMLWDRPTWDMAPAGFSAERLQQRIYENLSFGENIHFNMGGRYRDNARAKEEFIPAPEMDALKVMGLEPHLKWEDIKARYRVLAKKHHPDVHGGHNLEEEEKLKKINLAYSVLKIAYQRYKTLEKK